MASGPPPCPPALYKGRQRGGGGGAVEGGGKVPPLFPRFYCPGRPLTAGSDLMIFKPMTTEGRGSTNRLLLSEKRGIVRVPQCVS